MSDPGLPNYEVVPLRSDEIRVGLVQSRLQAIDVNHSEAGKRANLEHMLQLIDLAQSRIVKDLLVFGELPISGLSRTWSRQQRLNIAIDVPGMETEAIGEKAKQYNCYIKFGCVAKLTDWPGHIINMGVIVGPGADIIYQRWFVRNLPGAGFGTTVYDVLDEYVSRYGWEAVWPVARTDIGNIAYMPEVLEPEIPRALAIMGAEIGIRSITSGGGSVETGPIAMQGYTGEHTFRIDFQAACMANNIYGCFNNNAISEEDGVMWDQGTGYSAVYDCNGHLMTEATSHHETMLEVTIPIGAYRRKHSIPRFYKELYSQLYEMYTPKFPPNSFLKYLPESIKDATRHYNEISRW